MSEITPGVVAEAFERYKEKFSRELEEVEALWYDWREILVKFIAFITDEFPNYLSLSTREQDAIEVLRWQAVTANARLWSATEFINVLWNWIDSKDRGEPTIESRIRNILESIE